MNDPCRVIIDDQSTLATRGQTLFDAADAAGVRVPASCGRDGRCHECLLDIVSGRRALSPRTEAEAFLQGHYRLACQARIESTDEPIIARTLRREKPQIVTASLAVEMPFAPRVRRDGDRIRIGGDDAGPYMGAIYGLAMDIGTSTVVLSLHDLEHDRPAGVAAFENPQIFAGSNVLQRIHYELMVRRNELRHVLVNYINRAIGDLEVPREQLYEVVVAANPTMRDLFFGLPIQTLGELPFKSITQIDAEAGRRASSAVTTRAAALGLDINSAAQVYGLPVIGCHVGGDAAACLVAIGMARETKLVMLCDMGTNSEVVIGTHDRILAASSPAGPAFEGSGISCGMPALSGAIERVRLNGGGQVEYHTIQNAPARGICGSGLIDILAQLLRHELLTPIGRLRGTNAPLAIAPDRGIALSEQDISLLAQAKATSHAAHVLLADRFGAKFGDIATYYLAGGFATYIDLEHAQEIGLLPPVPAERVRKIGNAALAGALALLRNAAARADLESLVARIEHVELETDPRFFDMYVEGCHFGPMAEIS